MEQAKWYVLHTFSGYENVAKENLETVRDKFNLQDRIFDIIINAFVFICAFFAQIP